VKTYYPLKTQIKNPVVDESRWRWTHIEVYVYYNKSGKEATLRIAPVGLQKEALGQSVMTSPMSDPVGRLTMESMARDNKKRILVWNEQVRSQLMNRTGPVWTHVSEFAKLYKLPLADKYSEA